MSTVGRPIAAPMRATLLHSALTVLRRDGAAALTVRNITAEAGCSTTGVYTYFGGKQGLVEAIYLEGFESFDEALDYDGQLIEAGRAYRRWALANPTHYLVMFGRAVPEFVPGEQAAQRAASSFARLVEAVGRAGATDPLSSAYHVYATVHGYVMLELIGRGPVETEALDHLYEAGLESVLRAWR